MELNVTKSPLKDMTQEQFRDWLLPIVQHSLFVDRERLSALLMADAERESLTEAFRDFWEGYYYDIAFELDCYEECLLSILDSCETYLPLKHRVAIVESERKASPMGREVRRMGSYLSTDSVPRIKVSELPDQVIHEFLHKLVTFEFFAAHEQVVKLLDAISIDVAKLSLHETTDAEDVRLREAFYEFFVCHLELEQFLEDYAYDPDEELEMCPEVVEELEQSIADHESGKNKGRPLQEVAKEFGVTLKCTR